MKLKIGTFNILNTSCRYQERLPYLQKTLSDLDCDILGIQEVNYSGNSGLLNIENYNQVFIQLPLPFLKQEPEFRIDGNMVLIRSNIEIVKSYELIFSNQLRVTQFVRLKKENFEWVVGNTHLDHLSDAVRTTQIKELLDYCKEFADLPIVITGDFNFVPFDIPYNLMSSSFKSSYKEFNKIEAALTFPTGLIGEYADIGETGSLDYIWTRGNIKCLQSFVFTDCGADDVWASDHYPVCSYLEIEK